MQSSLAARVYQRAHLEGEFRLRSGATSREYFDKYLFESNPAMLREIAENMVDLIPADVDALAGLELGGVPVATVLSQLTGISTLFVRKNAKTYGTCRLAEGGVLAGRRLVVVEDVVTSGGQIVESVGHLRNLGASVSTALCVRSRGRRRSQLGQRLRRAALVVHDQRSATVGLGLATNPSSRLLVRRRGGTLAVTAARRRIQKPPRLPPRMPAVRREQGRAV